MIGFSPLALLARTPRAFWSGLGAAGKSTLAGAAAGGLYGAMSKDTSVLGGAIMGAGLGRYGASGFRRGMLGYRGIGVSGAGGLSGAFRGFGRGVRNAFSRDFRGASMLANRGYSRIWSGMKSRRGIMTGGGMGI